MKIYPAIDLINGECVRLAKGEFSKKTSYDKDPIILSKYYAAQGIDVLHVVDLDGAKVGQPKQTTLIKKMAKESGLKLQVGGGIRSTKQAEGLLASVDRIVIGSLATKYPAAAEQMFLSLGGDCITLALDVRLNKKGEPIVASQGWQEDTKQVLWPLIDNYKKVGLKRVLCTDIDRDGMMNGPNVALYQEFVERYPDIECLASGGVCSLDDIRVLSKIGVAGVIIGKALLDGKFELAEAMKEAMDVC